MNKLLEAKLAYFHAILNHEAELDDPYDRQLFDTLCTRHSDIVKAYPLLGSIRCDSSLEGRKSVREYVELMDWKHKRDEAKAASIAAASNTQAA